MKLTEVKERAEKYWKDYFSGKIYEDDLHGTMTYFQFPHLEGTVLDLGCGDLDSIRSLQGKNNAYIIGVDIAETPLGYTKKIYSDKKNRIDLVNAAAEYLPFPDNVFDKTFLVDVLSTVGDSYERIIEGAARVSKNIVASFLHKDFAENHPTWKIRKINDFVYDSPDWHHEIAFFTEEKVKDLLHKFGFEISRMIVLNCKQTHTILQPYYGWPYDELPAPHVKNIIQVEAVKNLL